MKKQKLFKKILASAENARFADVITLAKAFGFGVVRVRGSHHILSHPELPELLNLQERKGKAKPYQIRQLVLLVEEYNLVLGEDS